MNTFDAPPTTTPPHPFLPPEIAAGRPLMKTSREPSTTGAPLAVPSPTRAAGLPPRAFDHRSAARGAVADARRRLAADRRIRTALGDDAGRLSRNHGKPTARDDWDREQQRQCSHGEPHRFVRRTFR